MDSVAKSNKLMVLTMYFERNLFLGGGEKQGKNILKIFEFKTAFSFIYSDGFCTRHWIFYFLLEIVAPYFSLSRNRTIVLVSTRTCISNT